MRRSGRTDYIFPAEGLCLCHVSVPKPLAARLCILFVGSFGPLVVVTVTFMPFGVFSISQLSISHVVVSSGREASEKKRAEARRGQGQCWGEAGDGARELLP